MKSVLISVQPKWCELIASGKKTVEVRKNGPKLETPFKCYIYCTQKYDRSGDGYFQGKYCGKVIGEFICDELTGGFWISPFADYLQRQSCLSYDEICDYANGKPIFSWHISNLVIYDNPKELSEFRTLCKYRNDDGSCQYTKVECDCIRFDFNPDYSVNFAECCDYIIKPPQSWCYVESEVDAE